MTSVISLPNVFEGSDETSLSPRCESELPALMTQDLNGPRCGLSECQPERGQYLATNYQWKLEPGPEAEVVHLFLNPKVSLDLSSKIGDGSVNWGG